MVFLHCWEQESRLNSICDIGNCLILWPLFCFGQHCQVPSQSSGNKLLPALLEDNRNWTGKLQCMSCNTLPSIHVYHPGFSMRVLNLFVGAFFGRCCWKHTLQVHPSTTRTLKSRPAFSSQLIVLHSRHPASHGILTRCWDSHGKNSTSAKSKDRAESFFYSVEMYTEHLVFIPPDVWWLMFWGVQHWFFFWPNVFILVVIVICLLYCFYLFIL